MFIAQNNVQRHKIITYTHTNDLTVQGLEHHNNKKKTLLCITT